MLVGVLEAIVNCGQEASGIDVLNVGTTDEAFHVPLTHRRRGGVLRWVKGLPMLFMQAQSDAVVKQATILLGKTPYRVSPSVRPSRFSLDDARLISDLRGLGVDCARHHDQYLSPRFLSERPEPMVPFHVVDDTEMIRNSAAT
jgi:hypothetical protein